MEIVTLHELKDSYIELQKQRETRRKAMKKYRASTKGKAALARANKKYLDKQKQKTTKKTTKNTVAKKQ